MSKKSKATKEEARQILKKGILDMSVERLIQMSNFGLMGNIEVSNKYVDIKNVFNRIGYNDEKDTITFSIEENTSACGAISIIHKPVLYGGVSFHIDAITEISGCEDADNPDEYLNINIQLEDETIITINVIY